MHCVHEHDGVVAVVVVIFVGVVIVLASISNASGGCMRR